MPHVATVTIPAAASTLTDFPVVVTPNSVAAWDAFWATVTASGGDIRCYLDDDTTELAREVVALDTTGKTGEIHIKVGTVSNTLTTDIHIWADGSSSEPAVGATYGRNAVWADYEAVWHLQDTGTQTDSTGNGHSGTESSTAPSDAAGAFGDANGGLDFDGSSTYLEVASDAALSLLKSADPDFAVSIWLNPDTEAATILVQKDQEWGMQTDNLTGSNSLLAPRINTYGSNNTASVSDVIPLNDWTQFVAYYDPGTSLTAYVDGAISGSAHSSSDTSPALGRAIGIGCFFSGEPPGTPTGHFDGTLDEGRIRTGNMSNYVDAFRAYEHANQNDPPGWYTVAAAGGLSPPPWTRRRRFTPLLVR